MLNPARLRFSDRTKTTEETNLHHDFGEPRLTHRTVPIRIATRASFVFAFAFVYAFANLAPSAYALSFGGEQVTSALGQPLRVVIPLLGSTNESLENRCFRIVTPSRSDGLSVVTQARVELQTNTNPPHLIIRSDRSINDPVVRISVEAGCDVAIRRDYTLLLDPAPVQVVDTRPIVVTPPQSEAIAAERMPMTTNEPDISASQIAAIAATAAERAASRRAADAVAATRDRARTVKLNLTQSQALAPPVTSLATAKQPRKDTLEIQRGSVLNVATRMPDASLAALAVPRLRIDSGLSFREPDRQPGAAPVDELQAAIAKDRRARLIAAPIESDLAPRLEADLVVAQRRLSELQLQLAAAAALVATSSEPSTALASAAPATKAGWDWRNWIWVPGLFLVVGLVAFLLRQRRIHPQSQFAAASVATDVPEPDNGITTLRAIDPQSEVKNRPDTNPLNEYVSSTVPAAAVAATAAGAAFAYSTSPTPGSSRPNAMVPARDQLNASDRLNNPLFHLRDTAAHVDVTELSQVTDEAQVYTDLGRYDQAIALLRDHIAGQTGERISPAPWLMIFELYRRTSNRQGYDELAPLFRKHFNGRVPDWENYGHELARDGGLEAFPHLIASLERDWGTDDARKFLEELLYDNRGGSRLGFSLSAYRDILLLLQVHDGLSAEPNFAANATDWEPRSANDNNGTPTWRLSLETIEPPKGDELESFFKNPPPRRY